MAITPIVFLSFGKKVLVTNAVYWGTIYFISIVICSLLAFDIIQWNRIVFRGLYICMFISLVQIVESDSIPLESSKSFIKHLLIAYFIVLILQQLFMLLGLINVPVINLIRYRIPSNILKVNSLALEASHAVRIVTILFYTYIRICELSEPSSLSLKQFLLDNKYISIGYLYFIVSIGFATGLVGLFVIVLYFFKRSLNIALLVIAFIGILIFQFMGEQMDRINSIIESFSAEDIGKQMIKTEASGAARINGIINTFQYLDLSTKEARIGQGSSTIRSVESIYSKKTMIGDITNYGIITYILSLIFVFRASIYGIIVFIILLNIDVNIETIDRLKNVINAFLSDDAVSTLKKTESSGGSRIAPMINTITNLDLFSWETWLEKVQIIFVLMQPFYQTKNWRYK